MKKLMLLPFFILFLVFYAQAQEKESPERTGLYMGLKIGTWIPDGRNKVLGNSFSGGIEIQMRADKNMLGFTFEGNLGKQNAKKSLTITSGDSLIMIKEYSLYKISLNYGYQLWSKNRFMLEAIGGIGGGQLVFDSKNDDEIIPDKTSLIIDPGINFRYLFGKTGVVQFRVQYTMLNFDPKGKLSTNLKGNFLNAKIIIGYKTVR